MAQQPVGEDSHVKIEIVEGSAPGELSWVVVAGDMRLSFSRRESTQGFAEKLEERVNAPHQLPEDIDKPWAAEHYRVLQKS
ncbi:hypothetical protein D3C80_524470 [compost metagenome]